MVPSNGAQIKERASRNYVEKLRTVVARDITCEFIIIKPTLAAINELKRTIKVLTELFLTIQINIPRMNPVIGLLNHIFFSL